jgi:hypothetical protein
VALHKFGERHCTNGTGDLSQIRLNPKLVFLQRPFAFIYRDTLDR